MKNKGNLLQHCLLGAVLLHAFTGDAQPITKIAGGGNHSLFLKSDGSVWGMGDSVWGQLGAGAYSWTNLPEEIVATNVTAIAAGGADSFFLTSDGSFWATGGNSYGQLGIGSFSWTNPPVQIANFNATFEE